VRKLLAVAVIILVGLVAWNYATTGRITLFPGSELTGTDREVENLRVELRKAVELFHRAERDAGIGAVDTTADAEAAQVEVQRIASRFAEVERRSGGAAREGIETLKRELEAAKRVTGVH